ncbi:MBL fold metallo-hydrolase [Flaviflexus equikiangi]|uniref:MBL fold metallo-hydrolase n=1 Tax=Flaviflexus equikiangi TaxID=2758573 RepID=A0ABS2TFF8_9ACTO|nr:MBL fold metallo-hydrolase [Flaviflexus equikiangi]MBM9433386.1 MBL fold metallo-hydrolase [Flaviflexus equikiangi]
MRLFIYTETALEANCYIWENTETKQAMVVDPGAGSAGWVEEKLAQEGLELAGVLLTHGHPDHVWDAAKVAGDKPVFISKPDLYRLDDPQAHVPTTLHNLVNRYGEWVKPASIEIIPELCLQGSGAQILPGFPVRAIMVPGHTEGSVGYLTAGILEDGESAITISQDGCGGGCDGCDCGGGSSEPEPTAILFLGDVILGESIGRTDLPGGDDAEMKSTLRMITVSINPDTVLCTGHGQLSTLGYQLQANQYLRNAAMASA